MNGLPRSIPAPCGIYDWGRGEPIWEAAFAQQRWSERACFDCGEPLLFGPDDYGEFLCRREDGLIYALCSACAHVRKTECASCREKP